MSFSKDPIQVFRDAVSKGYSRVRFQSGKPLLDRELNLLGDLANPQRIAATYIGDGVPAGSDGFAILELNVATSDFTIRAGRCLVNGNEVVLAGDSTYRTQPLQENVVKFPKSTFGVYLRAFSTQISEAQDTALNNSGDVGFVTSLREKTDWEVIVSAVKPRGDFFQLATIDPSTNKITDTRRKGLTLETLRDEVSDLLKSIGKDQLAKAASNSKLVAIIEDEFDVGAATTPEKGQLIIPIENANRPAFYLASVRQVESEKQPLQPASFTWTFGNRAVRSTPRSPQLVQENILVIQNLSKDVALKIACKVSRVDEG